VATRESCRVSRRGWSRVSSCEADRLAWLWLQYNTLTLAVSVQASDSRTWIRNRPRHLPKVVVSVHVIDMHLPTVETGNLKKVRCMCLCCLLEPFPNIPSGSLLPFSRILPRHIASASKRREKPHQRTFLCTLSNDVDRTTAAGMYAF
jgi:hypothetical protein